MENTESDKIILDENQQLIVSYVLNACDLIYNNYKRFGEDAAVSSINLKLEKLKHIPMPNGSIGIMGAAKDETNDNLLNALETLKKGIYTDFVKNKYSKEFIQKVIDSYKDSKEIIALVTK